MGCPVKANWRKPLVGIVLFFLVIFLFFLFGRFADRYKIDFIVYQGNYYQITNEPISQEECGDYIGEVLRQAPMRAILGNEDFDSNQLPVGTKIYAMKEPDCPLPDNKLIVFFDDGYYAAYRFYDSSPFPAP